MIRYFLTSTTATRQSAMQNCIHTYSIYSCVYSLKRQLTHTVYSVLLYNVSLNIYLSAGRTFIAADSTLNKLLLFPAGFNWNFPKPKPFICFLMLDLPTFVAFLFVFMKSLFSLNVAEALLQWLSSSIQERWNEKEKQGDEWRPVTYGAHFQNHSHYDLGFLPAMAGVYVFVSMHMFMCVCVCVEKGIKIWCHINIVVYALHDNRINCRLIHSVGLPLYLLFRHHYIEIIWFLISVLLWAPLVSQFYCHHGSYYMFIITFSHFRLHNIWQHIFFWMLCYLPYLSSIVCRGVAT